MTDKKTPQRVPAGLFGASSQTTDLLGMSDDFLMSSPVTLGVGTSSSKETLKETTKAPSPLSSSKSSPSHSLTSSPLAKRKDPMRTVSSPATTDISSAELSNVPLNSPPAATKDEKNIVATGSTQQQVPAITSVSEPLLQMPTLSDKRSDPQLSTQPKEDDYPIHPVVKTDTPVAKPPPLTGDPAATANPYRLSAQQQKKPMFPSSPYLSSPQTATTIASQGPSFAPPPMTSALSSFPPASQNYGPPPMATQQQHLMATQQHPMATQQHPMTTQQHPMATQQHPVPLGTVPMANNGVSPVRPHWFYKRTGEDHWTPFSCTDSAKLEQHFLTPRDQQQQEEIVVPTDGGRYDVKFHQRIRQAIYWQEDLCPVRRCTWFFRTESDRWLQPYEENVSKLLEAEFVAAMMHNQWNKRVELGNGETVIMHSPQAIVHYPASLTSSQTHFEDNQYRPKAVRREFPDLEHITLGEQSRIDHLVFVVHGIGPVCDMAFRKLVDCVDDFREVSQLMLHTHQFAGQLPRGGMDSGGRVEFLPVHWHDALHSDNTGVDSRLKLITLPSISRLRDFTNSTLLDILFYTSPVYCQTIVNEVIEEINRMYELFLQRNPHFEGGVSLMGHSLGSCILYDILTHQGSGSSGYRMDDVFATNSTEPEEDLDDVPLTLKDAMEQLGLDEHRAVLEKEQIDLDSLLLLEESDLKELGIPMGPRKKLAGFIANQGDRIKRAQERAKQKAEELSEDQTDSIQVQQVKFSVSMEGLAGTGQPFVSYKSLHFKPCNLFLVGSPVGLFLTVRGVEKIGTGYQLPTCPRVHNIFHPFDPVAYRLEPLVLSSCPSTPYLMPHHKGRKRFHLELYENLGKMGANLKQNIVTGVRNMLASINEFARSHTTTGPQKETMSISVAPEPEEPPSDQVDTVDVPEVKIGRLNQGNRIDYVLQEKPIEKLNEYLFALSSHLCYWRSEDTALFVLKKAYKEEDPPIVKH